jgi:hypothetical protein
MRAAGVCIYTPNTRGGGRGAQPSQIGRATRYAYDALGTGNVNWKVAPGPASREAHIRPP